MKYPQHGKFSLVCQGDVLVVRYMEVWNEVATANLHEQARALWAQGAPAARWGMLSDLRDWGGCTPEALELWWKFFEDCVQHGMFAVTDVVPHSILESVVHPVQRRASDLAQYQRSESIEDAWQWLAAQGLRI